MSLRSAYTLFAPLYDAVVATATAPARQASVAALAAFAPATVLIAGIGTGLDIPALPLGPRYTAFDLTPAMLARARRRAGGRPELALQLETGDAQALAYADAQFDAVLLHLIVAVVPEPARVLAETARVLRPGGRAFVFDKFLRPGQRAPLRRALSPLLGRLASRTDVVFEAVCPPALRVLDDRPALAGGWFRRIVVEKG